MAELIAKTNLKREKGFLYYVKDDDQGNLSIWKAEMSRGKSKKN
jgi:hypothetical protein